MKIIGLSTNTHDTSVALVVDGQTRFLFEEERFNRQKHTICFPWLALDEIFKQSGLKASDIDIYAFSWKPLREITGNLAHFLKYAPQTFQLLSHKNKKNGAIGPLHKWFEQKNFKKLLQERYQVPIRAKIQSIDHHLCHASAGFYNSNYNEAVFLTLDGRGENITTSWGQLSRNQLPEIKQKIQVPHSLGHFYTALTDFVGFKAFADEWKLMGLSAYGSDRLVPAFRNLIQLGDDFDFKLNLKYFSFHTHGRQQWLSQKFYQVYGEQNLGYQKDSFQFKADVAYAVQKTLEETVLHLVRQIQKKTSLRRLVLSGGVALNCLMNSLIQNKTEFNEVFISPFPHDAGNALGAAQYVSVAQKINLSTSDFNPYLGVPSQSVDFEKTLNNFNLKFEKKNQIEAEVAQLIAGGRIVGWYQGAAEAGPRALGNRSVLADPRRADLKQRLNNLTKKRENFRPFAPSILQDQVHRLVEWTEGQTSPFMIKTGQVRPEWRDQLPAIVHVDGSMRVQTVTEEANARYYKLIHEFYQVSGVPALLNTSFNENEPIVNSAEQAVRCFLRTDLDVLVLGDYLVQKNLQ